MTVPQCTSKVHRENSSVDWRHLTGLHKDLNPTEHSGLNCNAKINVCIMNNLLLCLNARTSQQPGSNGMPFRKVEAIIAAKGKSTPC